MMTCWATDRVINNTQTQHMRNSLKIVALSVFVTGLWSNASGQTTAFDLEKMYKDKKLPVFNRDVSTEKDAGKNCIVLNETFGEGLAWVNDLSFSTGTIEIDLKGQDVFQHSFLGIAFHGINDNEFEAIYFRPFNFRTDDPERLSHAVQYIALPTYIWQKLREEQNGVYEKGIDPAPEPNSWFHAKIVVKETEVLVYVDNATAPCLKVSLLGKQKNGKIALYTADRSGGTFANLSVKPD